MAGKIYKRADGRWAFRTKPANGRNVATDGSQRYESKTHARSTLEKVLKGE